MFTHDWNITFVCLLSSPFLSSQISQIERYRQWFLQQRWSLCGDDSWWPTCTQDRSRQEDLASVLEWALHCVSIITQHGENQFVCTVYTLQSLRFYDNFVTGIHLDFSNELRENLLILLHLNNNVQCSTELR